MVRKEAAVGAFTGGVAACRRGCVPFLEDHFAISVPPVFLPQQPFFYSVTAPPVELFFFPDGARAWLH